MPYQVNRQPDDENVAGPLHGTDHLKPPAGASNSRPDGETGRSGDVATFEETPPTADDWARKAAGVTAAGLPFLVVEAGGKVAGFAYASPWRPRPAYRHTVEDTIYLAPDQTGKGLGGTLLGALLGRCADAGVRQVIAVIADTGSDASAALHKRHGFRHAGKLTAVGFKHGRWIDTTLLQLSR